MGVLGTNVDGVCSLTLHGSQRFIGSGVSHSRG